MDLKDNKIHGEGDCEMINKNMKNNKSINEPGDSQTYSMETDDFLASWNNRTRPGSGLRAYSPNSEDIIANWDTPKDRYHPPDQFKKPSVQPLTLNALPNGNERILVVDDEPAIVKLEEEFLSILGYHVVSKTDSVKALSLFQENPERFDLVITDMNMPSMEGDRLTQKILELRSDIPIIMCTGSFRIIDEETMKSMGLRECIIKPLRLKILAETVRRVLDSD
jgi:CheY-like chemotaxis protein